MKTIKYKGTGIIAKHNNPKFSIEFKGEPVEVEDEAAEILLRNPDFEEVTKKKKGD